MKFTKMHGLGNDYIYVNLFDEKKIEDPGLLARQLSRRHFSVGSDGLIIIRPSDKADVFMDIYNSDGSKGKMCGNGLRCVGKYVYEKGLKKEEHLSVETLSGVKELSLTVKSDKVQSVTVNMGKVLVDKEPVRIFRSGWIYEGTKVDVGNPHYVLYTDGIQSLNVENIGAFINKSEQFSDGVNVEFVHVLDRENIEMRVYERGAGETMACGSGACAAFAACYRDGFTNSKVNVKLLGGELRLEMSKEGEVFMTGGAELVYEGEINI